MSLTEVVLSVNSALLFAVMLWLLREHRRERKELMDRVQSHGLADLQLAQLSQHKRQVEELKEVADLVGGDAVFEKTGDASGDGLVVDDEDLTRLGLQLRKRED